MPYQPSSPQTALLYLVTVSYAEGVTVPRHNLAGWERRALGRRAAASDRRARVEALLPALRVLLAGFGATEAFVFGSVARGTARPDSDLDLAVRGCEPARFDRMAAEVERLFQLDTDVVDLEHAPAELVEMVQRGAMRVLP